MISLTDFPIIPAKGDSMAKRSMVCGVGINDSPYLVKPVINGSQRICPFYRVWQNMLNRCYSAERKPTYIGCTVCPEWHRFMAFRAWMDGQDWEGKYLDKDILILGNKVYGPDYCVFVDAHTNTLLNNQAAARGAWPLGVSFDKRMNNFRASCCAGGRSTNIGHYDTPEAAHDAWCGVKKSEIERCAIRQPDARVRDALILRSIEIGGSSVLQQQKGWG